MSILNEALLYAHNTGYIVDKSGDIFLNGKKLKGRIKTISGHSPYREFAIKFNNTVQYLKVHRLQALQKYGNEIFKAGIVVRHLNNNSLDNSYDNIVIGTVQDNAMDIPESTRRANAQHAASFITKYNHQEVYDFYMKTKSYKETMKHFDIASKSTVHNIVKKFNK